MQLRSLLQQRRADVAFVDAGIGIAQCFQQPRTHARLAGQFLVHPLAATVQYITGAEVVAPGLRRVGQGKG